jgi:hypothetical protein
MVEAAPAENYHETVLFYRADNDRNPPDFLTVEEPAELGALMTRYPSCPSVGYQTLAIHGTKVPAGSYITLVQIEVYTQGL